MIKFSIIIPVYNVQDYLKKCLDSVINQSYKNFEIIIINDGSEDDSESVIKSYKDKRIKYFYQKNSGLSATRNNGVLKASGEYLLFVDSDDYIEEKLLEVLNKELDKDYDLIRFGISYDYLNDIKKTKGTDKTKLFNNGIDAFNEIVNYEIIESPCCYLYKRDYYLKNKFRFNENTYHEDFGLIPLVILKAKLVKCINFYGYYYVVRKNSIMNSNSYDNIIRKANDLLINFNYLLNNVNRVDGNLDIFYSFIANSIILKSTTLKGNDYKIYLKKLKKLNVFNMLLSDTLERKIKKILIRISPKLYYKMVRR